MSKSRNTNGQKVKNSSRYERDMERSFAVIYHNLKRIKDEKPHQERPTRRYSESQVPNLALLQKYEQTTPKQRTDQSTETTESEPKPRRVSFSCSSMVHTFRQTIQEKSRSKSVEQACNFPEGVQESTPYMPYPNWVCCSFCSYVAGSTHEKAL